MILSFFLGKSPDRGRTPEEWGDFLFVRPSVRPPLRAQEPARQPLDPASQAFGPASQASEPARQASEPGSQPGLRASQPGLRASPKTKENVQKLHPMTQSEVPVTYAAHTSGHHRNISL